MRTPRDRYVINASLVPEAHRVDGSLSLRVCAPASAPPLTELWFHAYLNAFESSRSVFQRENGGSLRGVDATREGSLEIVSLNVGDDSASTIDYPGEDRTTFRVALTRALASGACVDVHATFRSHLPNLWARSGRAGDFFIVAQWFPKLAKLDPDGTWHADPYRGFGEFFADFADYELHVTTPSGWTSVASTDASGLIDDATDVVWIAAREFTENERISQGVRIRGVAHPSVAHDLERALDATEVALQSFSRRYGTYRWPNLTVVVPPHEAAGGAAMEYPSFIVAEPSSKAPLARFVRDVENTVFHEMAHQWFYARVASDEVRSPWLDEGPTTWIANDLFDETGGWLRGPIHVSPLSFDLDTAQRLARISPPPTAPASAFGNEDDYFTSVYVASDAYFETLARTNGRSWLQNALSSYARVHAGTHPTNDDLFASLRLTASSQTERDVVERVIVGFKTGDVSVIRRTRITFPERIVIVLQDTFFRALQNPKTTMATLAFACVAIVLFAVVVKKIRRS